MTLLIVGSFLSSCSFSLKGHTLTDQYRFPLYTSLLLVLPLCVNDSNNYTKRCLHEGAITGRFRDLRYRTSVLQHVRLALNSMYLTIIIECDRVMF